MIQLLKCYFGGFHLNGISNFRIIRYSVNKFIGVCCLFPMIKKGRNLHYALLRGITIPSNQDIRKCVHKGRIILTCSAILKICDFLIRTNKRCDIYILVSYVIVCPSVINLDKLISVFHSYPFSLYLFMVIYYYSVKFFFLQF